MKLLIFYPHNPEAASNGSHLRFLQQLTDLGQNNEILLLSTVATSGSEWPEDLDTLAQNLRLKSINLFERSNLVKWPDKKLFLLLYKCRIFFTHTLGINLPIVRPLDSFLLGPWFRRIVKTEKPDVIIIHYLEWISLIKETDGSYLKVVELHDLSPINIYLQKACRKFLRISNFGTMSGNKTPHELLLPLMKDSGQLLDRSLAGISAELRSFSRIWSISQYETNLLTRFLPQEKVATILPRYIPKKKLNTLREKIAIIPIGPNIFNTIGIINFSKEIGPKIGFCNDFKIVVTGTFWKKRVPSLAAPLHYQGFVKNFDEYLSSARLSLAPTRIGTGQQVKIFQSLACGTPVICYRESVPDFFLLENLGVWAVDNDAEFAETIIRAFRDDNFYSHLMAGVTVFGSGAYSGSYSDELSRIG